MKIHEYQAKELLAAAGASIPKHIIVSSFADAEKAFDQLSGGGGVVIKAQVHAGGRGQGQLIGYPDKLGGVKFVTSRGKGAGRRGGDAPPSAQDETDRARKGQKINKLMVQADAEPDKEFYLGMVLDRAGRTRADGKRGGGNGHRGSRREDTGKDLQGAGFAGNWPAAIPVCWLHPILALPVTRSTRPRRS